MYDQINLDSRLCCLNIFILYFALLFTYTQPHDERRYSLLYYMLELGLRVLLLHKFKKPSLISRCALAGSSRESTAPGWQTHIRCECAEAARYNVYIRKHEWVPRSNAVETVKCNVMTGGCWRVNEIDYLVFFFSSYLGLCDAHRYILYFFLLCIYFDCLFLNNSS